MNKVAVLITGIIITVSSLFAEVPTSYEEGGLCTHHDTQSADVTWNFIKHFTYEKYYYTLAHNWTTSNDDSPWGVDSYDFIYFCGHGSNFSICMDQGDAVNLANAGNNADNGYGSDLEFLVLHSCTVVPCKNDIADPYTPWLNEPGGIFDGLHVLCGFRTLASGSNDNKIASYMGELTKDQSGYVWENWLNACDVKGASGDMDKCCSMVAFKSGYFRNSSYDAYYDIYGGSVSNDIVNPKLWSIWMN